MTPLIDWLYNTYGYLTVWHGLALGTGLGICVAAYAEMAGNARARRRGQ